MDANSFAIAALKEAQRKIRQLEMDQEDSYPGQGRDKFLVGIRKIKPVKESCELCPHSLTCHATPNNCSLR